MLIHITIQIPFVSTYVPLVTLRLPLSMYKLPHLGFWHMCILCTQNVKSKIRSKFETGTGEKSSEKENDSQLKGICM